MDSYMYQTVGHELIEAYSTCMKIPLFRKQIDGSSACQTMDYEKSSQDEVEDLFTLLKTVKVCSEEFIF